ncbi:hypothetical protein, partial [uncultured Campylobacter sp.]|uniref:hypothetical protein n=1 Tax=uncultured Campylobacter sp. TaxID=218934 RepID=UPI0026095F71
GFIIARSVCPPVLLATYPTPNDTAALFRSVHVRKRKICSPLIRRIRPSAKFNREPCRKKQEPSNKAPDKILRRKIKSGSHKLAQKPDLESKFYAPLFKKAAI